MLDANGCEYNTIGFLRNAINVESSAVRFYSDEEENTKDTTTACSTLICINSSFEKHEEKTYKTTAKLDLFIIGSGDYKLSDKFIPFIKTLEEKNTEIESLVLHGIEIEADTLKEIFALIKGSLRALMISQTPLDSRHLELINKQTLNLTQMSLLYIEADGKLQYDDKTANYQPFNINELLFEQLGKNMRSLTLQGVSLKKKTIDNIKEAYANSLINLRIENIVKKEQDLMKFVLDNIKGFKVLKTLSLAGNNMSHIDFKNNENPTKDDSRMFPEGLLKLNLNYCKLTDQQIQTLMRSHIKGHCRLEAIHIQGCYVNHRNLDLISKTIINSSIDEQKLMSEFPKPILGTKTDDENLLDASASSKKMDRLNYGSVELLFTKLEDNYIEIQRLLKKNQKIAEMCEREGSRLFLPYLLKALPEIMAFQDSYRREKVEFFTNPDNLIPKNDINRVLGMTKHDDQNSTFVEKDIIGVYDIPLIQKVHPKVLTDDVWAKESIQKQREKFRLLLDKLKVYYQEIKHKDCVEDVYIVLKRGSKEITWDYTLATFSIFWYDSLGLVSVKFNLSDDWFLDKNERTNHYAAHNLDYLVDFCSSWNCHANDFVFELDIPTDGEAEIKFKATIMKNGDLNLARALLIHIDKGFLTLKKLQKKIVFNQEDSSRKIVKAKELRKEVKLSTKKYEKSAGFLKLLEREELVLADE